MAIWPCASDVKDRVATVRKCCLSTPDPGKEIIALLNDLNWRPHLVAAVASLFTPRDEKIIENLWHRVDRGSWVVPQVTVVLSLLDRNFENGARQRLENLCPLDLSELLGMSALERHSAAGPAGKVQRSAKAAKSLAYLMRGLSQNIPWLDELERSEEYQNLVAQDLDNAEGIAEEWREMIIFLRREIEGGENT